MSDDLSVILFIRTYSYTFFKVMHHESPYRQSYIHDKLSYKCCVLWCGTYIKSNSRSQQPMQYKNTTYVFKRFYLQLLSFLLFDYLKYMYRV